MKKTIKKLTILGILWYGGSTLWAQNLVPNGDFEESIVCFEYNLECGPMGWRLTSADPPSYYNELKKGDTIISSHWTAFVPYSLHSQSLYREYLQTQLLCPLIKGHRYQFSMKIKAEEFAVKEFGVLFLAEYILKDENTLIMAKPQLNFYNDHFWFHPKGNWMEVSQTFVANGNEKFLVIGNFKSNILTYYKEVEFSGKEKRQSTYYVDNVKLISVDHDPVCDFSKTLSILRNNRWRHTNLSINFFPTEEPEIPKVFDSIKPEVVQLNKPIILDHIYFEVDKYELLPASFKELETLYTILFKNNLLTIEIRGHTDNTGDEIHNRELSFHRAKAVADFLTSKGISGKRISVKGYASDLPIDTNQTPEGRQKNRRVEFVLK